MKLNELVRNISVWVSNEEQCLLDNILEPRSLDTFTDRDKTIIESLTRKSLLIIVQGKNSTYVYPNT